MSREQLQGRGNGAEDAGFLDEAPAPATRRRGIHTRRWERVGFLFVLPAVAFIAVFMLYPLLSTAWFSVTDFNFLSPDAPVFIGLQNYLTALSDPLFLTALCNTLVYGSIYFIGVTAASLALALFLFQRIRFTGFFASAIFMPLVVPLSLAALVFVWILQPNFGLLDHFLANILAQPAWTQNWLGSGTWAMAAIILVGIWATVGFMTILFLSGLRGIGQELLESADVDGATGLRQVFYIVLPNLRNTYVVAGSWAVIQGLKVFVEPMVMTDGGPGTSTLVLYQHVFRTAFSFFDMGYASAMAYILAFIVMIFVGLNLLVGRSTA